MKKELREPISPLDCFYSAQKELGKKYITFNLFDYEYYSKRGFDVVNHSIRLEEVFDSIKKDFDNKEKRIVSFEIDKKNYLINIYEIYSYLCPGNAYKYAYKKLIENYINSKIEIRYYYRKGGGDKKFSTLRAIKVIAECIYELFIGNKFLVEKHPTLNRSYTGNNLINNKIFNLIYRRKIRRTFKDFWTSNKYYFDNDYDTYGQYLFTFIETLLYLDFKEYKEIVISNFIGPQQQAAICYANSRNVNIKIIQHGRYMVHHLPGVIQSYFYKDKNIYLWEEEFINSLNITGYKKLNMPVERIIFKNTQNKEPYILIATSLPMLVDLDIYFKFWATLKELMQKTTLVFKIKLHKMDILTPLFLNFFSLSIEVVEEIESIPYFAIVLNSTIYYELKNVTEVFDFKVTTGEEEILLFIKENKLNLFTK